MPKMVEVDGTTPLCLGCRLSPPLTFSHSLLTALPCCVPQSLRFVVSAVWLRLWRDPFAYPVVIFYPCYFFLAVRYFIFFFGGGSVIFLAIWMWAHFFTWCAPLWSGQPDDYLIASLRFACALSWSGGVSRLSCSSPLWPLAPTSLSRAVCRA